MASEAEIRAAAERLRGHLVQTPLIGGLSLPGRTLPPGLRIKPEMLQPAGSIHFRGAMHWMLRQLGAPIGLALHGEPRALLAAAVAAAASRIPVLAFPVGEPDSAIWTRLQALDCEVRPRESAAAALAAAEDLRATEGFAVMPGAEHPDYLAGVATAGLELAHDLPGDTELVVVSPGALARALALGLAAGGASVRVEAIEDHLQPAPHELLREAREHLRLDLGRGSLAALWWCMEHAGDRGACVVLSD